MASRRHLHRPDSQGRQARQLAGAAIRQGRPDHQHEGCQGTRAHGSRCPAEPRRQGDRMIRRREFIAGLGSAAAWPVVARSQQPTMPVVGFIQAGSRDATPAYYLTAFRAGLGEIGVVEGQNVTVEYHWIEGHYNDLPELMADLVAHRVAVIATVASTPITLA